MNRSKQPTIVDVASEAGVSIATVSNVINRRKVPMAPETIRKVEEAVVRLGYRRNVMATNLSRRRSYELGLIIPHFGGYYGRFAEKLEQRVHHFGYHLSIFSAAGMDPEIEQRHLEHLLQRRVDGLVSHGLAMSMQSTQQLVGEGTPLSSSMGGDGQVKSSNWRLIWILRRLLRRLFSIFLRMAADP